MTDFPTSIGYVARSSNRLAILESLVEEGSTTRAEVYADVDASRSTVRRTVQQLEDHGWIREGDGEIAVTALGQELAGTVLDARERALQASRLGPFLEHVPASAFDLDLAHLADAEVTVASEGDPYAPVDRLLTLRADADRIWEASPVVLAEGIRQIRRRAVASNAPVVELVMPAETIEMARQNPNYRDAFDDISGAGPVTIHVAEGSIQFSLGLVDDRAFLASIGDAGRPQALVETDEEPVLDWVRRRFSRLRHDAQPVTA